MTCLEVVISLRRGVEVKSGMKTESVVIEEDEGCGDEGMAGCSFENDVEISEDGCTDVESGSELGAGCDKDRKGC